VRLPVRGLLTVVRPATDHDVDRLVAWHADPEVSRYWDDETFTREQMLDRLHCEDVDCWIIESDGEPVGYLQSWWEVDLPRRGGLDGFLLPQARGRGLMPDAARALAKALLAAGWDSVTVDPSASNEQALRGWAKAGFVEISRHEADEEHRKDWVLMRFEAPVSLRARNCD
jgi:aminoglycoside 6'-N-acetyltransferase